MKIRIFIAIDFDKSTKLYFQLVKSKLEQYCSKGRFTDIANFHLTLQFIGELEECNIPDLIDAIQACVSQHDSFRLTLDKPGIFKKGNSNILWIGINYSENLVKIHEKLCLVLKHKGIAFDEKPLRPHITLGRKIIFKKEIGELINLLTVDKMIIPVNNITIMESKRVNGKLIYVPIATLPLVMNRCD